MIMFYLSLCYGGFIENWEKLGFTDNLCNFMGGGAECRWMRLRADWSQDEATWVTTDLEHPATERLCCGLNTLTWFRLFSPMWTEGGGGVRNSQDSVTMQSQLPAPAEECSLCGGGGAASRSVCARLSLEDGVTQGHSPIQTLSKRCMSTVNRNSNNTSPRTPHLTISASAVNSILSVWARCSLVSSCQTARGSEGAGRRSTSRWTDQSPLRRVSGPMTHWTSESLDQRVTGKTSYWTSELLDRRVWTKLKLV